MKKQTPFKWLCLALAAAILGLSSGSAAAQQSSPSATDLKARLWVERALPAQPLSPSPQMDAPAPVTEASPLSVSGIADWTRIAFESYVDDSWEIYLARGDGSEPVRVTDDSHSDVTPRLNRGATRVAFSSDRAGNYDIYTVNVDGSGFARLTSVQANDASPAWSPDGGRIAFATKRDGNYEIYAMNPNGTSPVRLTVEAADDVTPAWSPDGSQIAWVRESGSGGAIWVMNADGANPHALTPIWTYLENPAWSPDGARLAFDYDADGDGWNELAIINADGSGLYTVWDPPVAMVDYTMGAWSPNGQWLLYSDVAYVSYGGHLYIQSAQVEQVRPNGHEATSLLIGGYYLMPDWQTEDLAPPQSQVGGLPQYSRAYNVPVQWSGADVGKAGIVGYDVQVRSGVDGGWTDWFTGTSLTSAPFDGPAGTTFFFRCRARDESGNVEAWPAGDGDASTTLFTWVLDGQVTDNRGGPLAHVPLAIVPTPLGSAFTDVKGRYATRLAATGAHSLGISHAGYAEQPASPYEFSSDKSLSFYLRPLDDVVENGGFEVDVHALTDWIPTGTLPAVVTTTIQHTGAQAAFLGLPCAFPCLAETEQIPFDHVNTYDAVAADAAGTLHVAWGGAGPLFYGYRTPQGAWVGPTQIGDTISTSSGYLQGLAVDGSGIVHAVWSGEKGLYYSQKTPSGDWTTQLNFGGGQDAAVAADSRGGVHLISRCYDCAAGAQIYYTERLPSGVWLPPRPLDTGNGYMRPGIAVGPDDSVHLVWQEVGLGVYYQGRSADGTWSAKEQLFSGGGYSFDKQLIAAGPQGELFAFWTWANSGYYATKAPGAAWSAAEATTGSRGDAGLAIDDQGTVHLISTGGMAGEEGTFYRRKVTGEGWSAIAKLSTDYHTAPAMVVDRFGVLHALLFFNPSTHHLSWQGSTEAGEGSLSQVVTVPAEMVRPTLAFEYKLRGAVPESGSGLEVRLSDGSTGSQVPLPTAGAGLSLAWVDVGPWAGKTITVTFALAQAAGEPHVGFFLDDVSLGSWLTPVVSFVSPSHTGVGQATSITITGENFVAIPQGGGSVQGPTVRLNETVLADAHWVSATTLTATAPPLPPGTYDVWVTNPGGQEGVLLGGFDVGKQVYVPVVPRVHAQ